jgi:hypothetical protein
VLAVLALAASAVIAFLEGTAGGVSYAGEGWFHECAKWDAVPGVHLPRRRRGGGARGRRRGAGGRGGEDRARARRRRAQAARARGLRGPAAAVRVRRAGRLRARLVAPPLPHTTRRARYVRTLGGLLAAPEIYLSLSFFSGGTG